MPGFESSRRFRWISATNSDQKKSIKSRFEYNLDQILAGGRSNRISLIGLVILSVKIQSHISFS